MNLSNLTQVKMICLGIIVEKALIISGVNRKSCAQLGNDCIVVQSDYRQTYDVVVTAKH